jgi:hypothetical protein
MRYTKLTVLGLCAMLVGLMALGASAAQAEKDNAWVILTSGGVKELVKKPLLPVLEGKLENSFGALDADVLEGSVHVEISCTGGNLVGVHLEEEGKLTEGGKVTFTGCSVKINGEAAPECKVHSSGQPVGTVTTNEGKGLLELHLFKKPGEPEKTELITLVKPKTGETFVTLLMGAECVIGEEVPINGYLAIRDCELKAEVHLLEHLIEEEPSLTLLHVLDDTSASILGSALVRLVGDHTGLKWGAEMFKL